MGIQDLQTFIDTSQIPGSSVPVDLLRIARGLTVKTNRHHKSGKAGTSNGRLSLVVDGECCLHRLYGGYFSDWVCGGQWNRMVQYLASLVQTIHTNNIELAVFFNGCLEQQRMNEWKNTQLNNRHKVNQVLKHINIKGTPPPKVWWTAPSCLRTCLRMALRHLSVTVVSTMDDHHQEVIAFCRENCCYGLMADDGEYAVFDPPHYFSSEHIKLTYKGSLETKEYIISKVGKDLGISTDRLCVVAALLGSYLLPDNELLEFYERLGLMQGVVKASIDTLVKTIASYVKGLPSVEDLDSVGCQIFDSTSDPRVAKFKNSVQYYLNGTKDGFLRYRTQATHRQGHSPFSTQKIPSNHNNVKEKHMEPADNSKFASETAESERDSLQAYNEATANSAATPQIVIEPPGISADDKIKSNGTEILDNSVDETIIDKGNNVISCPPMNGVHSGSLIISVSSSSSSSTATSPSRTPENKIPQEESPIKSVTLPSVPPEVMRTASERHQKGLMSPYIYQILTQGEIKLPVLMEDENHKDIPSIHLVFRPIRRMVYAILFNLHHYIYMASKQKDKREEKIIVPDICIKEWVWSKQNQYQIPDCVRAKQIGWGVPTVQRLWFGSAIDDKRRRLRAFLTCMRSDTPLMLNPTYVPQHLLVIASVLRFIMSYPEKILLHKIELDVFIAQAFSPALMNAHELQELQLPMVTSRGVQLAALFMQGVETALLANDACGAPIPWLMCCPWLFFDGKLFHHKLARAPTAKSLLDLCEHRYEYAIKVERMRQAILEGLDIDYCITPAQPQLPGMRVRLPPNIGSPPAVLPSPARPVNALNVPERVLAQRGIYRRNVPSRGGQLQVAGVIVGSWGPNYGTRAVPAPSAAFTHRPSVGHVSPPQGFPHEIDMEQFHIGPIHSHIPPCVPRKPGKHFGGSGRGKKNQSGGKKKSTGSKKGNKDAEKKESKKIVPPDETHSEIINGNMENVEETTAQSEADSLPLENISESEDLPNGTSSQNLDGSGTMPDIVASAEQSEVGVLSSDT